MEIIPAIDVIRGKCVRLTRGDFNIKKVYKNSPLAFAKILESKGFKSLHIIDLEGSKMGRIVNWPTVRKIAKNCPVSLAFGGGVRKETEIEELFSAGVDKVILGALIAKEPAVFEKILKKFGPNKIVAAVDIRKNGIYIYYDAWQKRKGVGVYSLLGWLEKLGVKTVMCTDIARDGTLSGINVNIYRKLVKRFPRLQIIAAGGVRSIKDLKELSEAGVWGAIVGKAISEKRISLDDLKIFI